jgi:2-methylisocitrate lyase-like PEP mutase family enzyme
VREIRGPLTYNRTGVSPRLSLQRLNELGIAMVANASGALRSSTVAMVDYFDEFAKDDVEAVKSFEARTKDHSAGNMHAYIGFSDIKKLEEEFLPGAEILAKYEGSVGFQP